MLELVRERLHGDAPAVSRVTIAGHRLPTGADRAALAEAPAPEDRAAAAARIVALRELLAGSSFVAAAPAGDAEHAGGGARWTAWGRGAGSQFTGSDGALSLDGQVLTATAGADYERAPLLAGLAVSYTSWTNRPTHLHGGALRLRFTPRPRLFSSPRRKLHRLSL